MFTAADFTFVPQDEKVTCPRCKHSKIPGRIETKRGYDHCFRCTGTTKVLTRRDQKAFDAVAELTAGARDRIKKGATDATFISSAMHMLARLEPRRVPAMYASAANGRVDAVVNALIGYARTHADVYTEDVSLRGWLKNTPCAAR